MLLMGCSQQRVDWEGSGRRFLAEFLHPDCPTVTLLPGSFAKTGDDVSM